MSSNPECLGPGEAKKIQAIEEAGAIIFTTDKWRGFSNNGEYSIEASFNDRSMVRGLPTRAVLVNDQRERQGVDLRNPFVQPVNK